MNNTDKTKILKKIEELSWDYSEKKFRSITPGIIEALINLLRQEEEFEIGISSEMWQKASVIKYDFPDICTQAEIKQKSDYYELSLLYYHAGLVQHRHKLDKNEADLLPQPLKKLMTTVKELGESVRFSTRSIDN